MKPQVRVAVINAQPAGFIICIRHYIDMLSAKPEYIQRGVASALLKPLVKSKFELTVDASIAAEPFLKRYGLQTVKQQCVKCRGVWFTNFHMRHKPQYQIQLAVKIAPVQYVHVLLFHKLQGSKS